MSEKITETNAPQQSKGKKILKTIINSIINVLIVVVLLVSILIAALALTSKANNGISTIFGNTFQPIQSDSMKGGSPDGYGGSEFEKGDLMIAKATDFDSSAKYELGDIVTFVSKESDGSTRLIAHRIVDVTVDQSGAYRYQTQGDNRKMAQVPDQEDVTSYLTAGDIASVYYKSDYEGKILKGVGNVIDYLQSQQGFFFVVLLPMIIFFMYELIRVVLNATNYKKTKANEEKDAAVQAAVAEALAQQSAQKAASAENAAPAEMTQEELEEFRKFREFQRRQKELEDKGE